VDVAPGRSASIADSPKEPVRKGLVDDQHVRLRLVVLGVKSRPATRAPIVAAMG
jgi:hypothetical protein